jgi:hypothetical protein
MSGFLARLAMRESGAIATMNPRLPSWFEPAAAAAGGTWAQAPDMPAPVPTGEEPGTAAPPRPGPVLPDPVQIAPPPFRSTPYRQNPQLPALLARPAVQSLRQTIMHAATAQSSAAAPAAPAVHAVHQAEARAALMQPARRQEPGSLPAPALRDGDSRPEPARNTLAPRVAQPAPQQAALQASSVRMAPALVQAARSAPTLRFAAAAPAISDAVPDTIHVTIGRLEVRAVQSAKAPVQPRSVQSPTSLDEYLGRRNGEVRR